MSFQSLLLLCPRLHYHNWRISFSRSTLSPHILHQGRRGNGNISYEKLQPPISPLNGWCLTICGQVLTIILPTEATKCPILKRLDKNMVHLVGYQTVPGESQPRKRCKAPVSSKYYKEARSYYSLHPGGISQSCSPAISHNPPPKNNLVNSHQQP